MKVSIIYLLLTINLAVFASPNMVINLSPHYDKNHDLITPDKVLLAQAINAYLDGYNKTALVKFHQSASFGNSNAQKYIGLMHIKSLGVEQNWAKGYAWIKLSALDGSDSNTDLMINIYKMLKPDEIKQADIEYKKISKDYDISSTLQRRARWVRKQNLKATGTRTGSQTVNVQTQDFKGVTLDNNKTGKLEQMHQFVNNYQFGQVTLGEIKNKE